MYYYYLLHGGCGCTLHFLLLLVVQEVRMQTNANPGWAANTIADTRDCSILEVHSKWVVVCVPGESFAFPGNTITFRGIQTRKADFLFLAMG